MNDGFYILALAGIGAVFVFAFIRWVRGDLSPIAQEAYDAVSPLISQLQSNIGSLQHKTKVQQQAIEALQRRVAELESRLPPNPPA